MKEFLDSFVPAPDGSWTCIRPCSHPHARGTLTVAAGARFRRGQVTNGIDVASLLDHRQAFALGD